MVLMPYADVEALPPFHAQSVKTLNPKGLSRPSSPCDYAH
jgi:hypothetical protein